MNCNTFRNKLSDYMGNSMIFEMKQTMEKHLCECESCKRLYEEEKELDNMLIDAFKIEDVKFNSSRASIIKNIDKNRYNSSMGNKLKFHFIKYKLRYASYAAVLAVALFSAPMVLRSIGMSQRNNSREIVFDAAEQNADLKLNESQAYKAEIFGAEDSNISIAAKESFDSSRANESAAQNRVQETKELKSASEDQEEYVPKFKRIDLDEKATAEFATKAIASPDERLMAQLDGRGEAAADEGIADIFITASDNKKWELQMVDNIKHTPMYIAWVDNENLLTTIGAETNGHATYGGNVYMINVNNGKSVLVYKTSSIDRQVSAIFKEGNSFRFIVKHDETLYNITETKEEEVRINFAYITDKNDAIVKVLYEYAAEVSDKKIEDALNRLTASSKEDYATQIGDIKNINGMEIIKVIDITGINDESDSSKNNSDSRIYYVQVKYDMNNTAINAQGSETVYQKVELVKEKPDSGWKIKGIYMIPQSKVD